MSSSNPIRYRSSSPPRPPHVRAVALGTVALVAVLGITGTWAVVAAMHGATAAPLAADFAPAASVPAASPLPNPYSTGLAASLVLGQANFNTAGPGFGANQLGGNGSLAFGPGGALWATDTVNNRVIEYLPPFADDESASVVIGQAGFTTNTLGNGTTGLDLPKGLAFDPKGDLWVADWANNRILEYVPPLHDGMAASLVLGQAGFTTTTAGTTAATLDRPNGLSFDAQGDLWVADQGNNRVLEFVPPFHDGMNASLVLGQKTFTTVATAVNQTSLEFPSSVAVSPSGAVWVSDWQHARLLEFLPPFADGMRASVVLGEPSFNTTTELLPYGIYNGQQVAVDASGDVWLVDASVGRAQEYLPGFSISEPQAVVLGHSSFTGYGCGTNASTLCSPSGIAIDAQGDVWVLDAGNDRILEYVPYGYAWTFGETGLSSGTSWTVTVDGTSYSSTTSTIVVKAPNGTHAFSVGAVSGYRESPGSGSAVVNASPTFTSVEFSPTILGLDPGTFAFLVADLAIVVVGGAIIALSVRRQRRGKAPPPPLTPSPASSTVPPPPGPAGPPSPPA